MMWIMRTYKDTGRFYHDSVKCKTCHKTIHIFGLGLVEIGNECEHIP
jgi:hypothetical protein